MMNNGMTTHRKAILMALAVLAGALALRLINCNRGMWGDEITTSWISRMPPERIVEERLAHNHLPTYFLLMRLWTDAVGTSKFTLRLPSIIPGAITVAAFFLICARRFPPGLALLAATLLGLNSTHLFISQSSRMYGLTVLLEVLFFGCLLAELRAPSWKRYAGYAAIVVAGCVLHLLFLQMAAITAVLIIWEARTATRKHPARDAANAGSEFSRRANGGGACTPSVAPKPLVKTLIRYLSPFLLGGVLMIVWVNHAAIIPQKHGKGPEISWLNVDNTPLPLGRVRDTPARRRVVDPLRTMIRIPFGDTLYCAVLQQGWPKYAARIGLWMIAGGLLWAAFRRVRSPVGGKVAVAAADSDFAVQGLDSFSNGEQRLAMRFALLWVLVPPLTLFVGEMLWPWVPGPQPRWLGGAAAAWALLLACGVCRFPGPVWSRGAMLVTVVSLSGFFALAWLRYPGDGLPQAFAYWRAHASPEDKVFLVHRGYLEHAMEIEGVPLPPEPLHSGVVLDDTGPELAQHLREFGAGNVPVWVLHYQGPRKEIVEEALALLPTGWRVELVFNCTATSVYRLSPVAK
jgi:hypothetical protein